MSLPTLPTHRDGPSHQWGERQVTTTAAARHTPRLEARFGASTASVVDLALPTKTRAGYHVIAEFSREQYDARLAFAIAAAPELLEALSAAQKMIFDHLHILKGGAQMYQKTVAAIAKARGDA